MTWRSDIRRELLLVLVVALTLIFGMAPRQGFAMVFSKQYFTSAIASQGNKGVSSSCEGDGVPSDYPGKNRDNNPVVFINKFDELNEDEKGDVILGAIIVFCIIGFIAYLAVHWDEL